MTNGMFLLVLALLSVTVVNLLVLKYNNKMHSEDQDSRCELFLCQAVWLEKAWKQGCSQRLILLSRLILR